LASLAAEQLSCDTRISTASTTTTTHAPPVIIVGPKRSQFPINKIRLDSGDNFVYDNKIRRTSVGAAGLETILNQKKANNNKLSVDGRDNKKTTTLTRMDTMIIGIIAGIIAFITILVVIVCIIKIKSSMSSSSQLSHLPPIMTGMTKGCTCGSFPGPCHACSLSQTTYATSAGPNYATSAGTTYATSSGIRSTRPLSIYGPQPIRQSNYSMKMLPAHNGINNGINNGMNNGINRRPNGQSPKGSPPGNSYFIYSDIPEEGFK